jgi:hypothetical protein
MAISNSGIDAVSLKSDEKRIDNGTYEIDGVTYRADGSVWTAPVETHHIIGKSVDLGPFFEEKIPLPMFRMPDMPNIPLIKDMPNIPVLSEESRQEMESGKGTKDDRGKLPIDLLPYESLCALARVIFYQKCKIPDARLDELLMPALMEVVRVLDFGAQKYTRDNWRNGMLWHRVSAAAQRHILLQWLPGEDLDPETKVSHLAHALCCVIFLLWYEQNPKLKANDDRFTKYIEQTGQDFCDYPHSKWVEGMSWRNGANYVLHELMLWQTGNSRHQKSCLSRLGHVAYGLMFLLSYELNPVMKKNDDRFVKNQ